jgi:phage shock protein E
MADRDAHSRRTLFFALGTLLVLAAILITRFRGAPGSVSVSEARELLSRDSSVMVLDVRTAEEFFSETGHLEGAILLPVQELERRIDELASWKFRTIVVYCRSGRRSRNAATLLGQKGYRAINLEGGIVEWNNQHYPVRVERVK